MARSYKFLIVDTYYPDFLASLYRNDPQLAENSYAEQLQCIMGHAFGTADFYSKNLRKLGCEAEEIIANNETLQRKWAAENGVKAGSSVFSMLTKNIPYVGSAVAWQRNTLLQILEAQIKKARPDVLYMQDLSLCPPDFLPGIKNYVKLIIGQIACPLPRKGYLKYYDLILTSFPHYVNRFREMGKKSEYLKLAFEPSVLENITPSRLEYPCTFVGGIGPAHKKGLRLLEALALSVDIIFFGYGAETLERDSPILPRHRGEVWGLDMYEALASSSITINRHIDVAENYANNMRLYEATGCGALLVTDFKDNLHELFVPDKEVVAYRSVEEAVQKIKYYLEHEDERKKIAEAGQKRTLSEHTYYNRMEELCGIIEKYI